MKRKFVLSSLVCLLLMSVLVIPASAARQKVYEYFDFPDWGGYGNFKRYLQVEEGGTFFVTLSELKYGNTNWKVKVTFQDDDGRNYETIFSDKGYTGGPYFNMPGGRYRVYIENITPVKVSGKYNITFDGELGSKIGG